MNKNYKEVGFWAGCTIERAVGIFLDYKAKGILTCGEFNEVTLYSDTVTLDGAYKEITGKTKMECEKAYQEWLENYDKQEREFKETIPALSKEWIERGHKILPEDRWEYWDKIVPVRLNDLYQGMELGNCLDIVDVLNSNGTLDEAKAKINSQDHSGMSYSLVRAMVREFCNRGQEFYDYTKL